MCININLGITRPIPHPKTRRSSESQTPSAKRTSKGIAKATNDLSIFPFLDDVMHATLFPIHTIPFVTHK
jgi:hypothetical protein